MIGRLTGTVIEKNPPYWMIEVQGVGYELESSLQTCYQLPELGQLVTVFTHLLIREDAHKLYAFFLDAERQLFRQLIKVTGVGAKVALAILSHVPTDQFYTSVLSGELVVFTKIPGVGKKIGERLLLEMADISKQSVHPTTHKSHGGGGGCFGSGPLQEALSALVALGYKEAIATKILQKLEGQNLSAEALIRLALKGGLA